MKSIVRVCMHQLGDPSLRSEGRVDCLLEEPRARFYPSGPVSMIHAIAAGADDEHELELDELELVSG